MYKQHKSVINFFVVALAFVAGYTLYTGAIFTPPTVQARSLVVPSDPHILYLTPSGDSFSRGALSNTELQNRKVTLVHDWSTVRRVSTERLLDAVIIDATLLGEIDATSQNWLRSQFLDGVTIVGLGTDDDQLTQQLGFKESLNSRTGNPPIEATEYRLLQSMVLGQPDEVQLVKKSDWLDQIIRGENKPIAGIESPLVASYGSERGKLDTAKDIDGLFSRIQTSIEEAYQLRFEHSQ